jgi:hypothetical protein
MMNLKANSETRKSHFRFKGWNQVLSSYGYGSTAFKVYSPTSGICPPRR